MKKPTLRQKLVILRDNMKSLRNYDRGFVRSMLEGTSGLGENPPDYLLADYLSDKQVDYINKLWGTYGITRTEI